MSRRLLIVPDADRVEQWLLEESRRASFVDLRDVWTLSELMERLEPATWAHRFPADPLLVQMLFGKLAGPHLSDAFGPSAHGAEFAAQARELVAQLRSQAVTPRALEEAAGAIGGSGAARARALAVLWRAVDEALEKQKLVDRGEWWRLAVRRLDAEGLPASMRVFGSMELKHFHDVPPSRLALFGALAAAAKKSKLRFAWSWPASGESGCDAFVVESVRAAEAAWAAHEAELIADVPEGELAWLGPRLFSSAGSAAPRPAPELTAFTAPTSREELREIARQIHRLVSAGVPPESICVAMRDVAEDTELIVEALADVGIPARARRGVPLTQSAHGRIALSLLELADDGFPADAVASVLESRAVKILGDEAADPRAAFREFGIRDDLMGATERGGAYSVRLFAAEKRVGERGRSLGLLRVGVEQLLTWCRQIPEQAAAQDVLEAWWDTVTKSGLLSPAPPARIGASVSTAVLEEFDRAAAREQAATDALAMLLNGLKEALAASGLATTFMTRAEFSRWVRSAAAELNLDARGARAGAVWVLDVRELTGRRFVQLFLAGLIDGRFPARTPPQPLLSEDERSALNVAAKSSLFRLSVGEGEVRVPTRLAEDRLLFHLAVSSSAAVTVSRSRFDDGGRELLPSPFWHGLERHVESWKEETHVRLSVPALDDVRTEADLRVRVALDSLSPELTRQSPRDPRAVELGRRLSSEPWFERARAASSMERERLAFFSDPSLREGAFSGQVAGEVLGALQTRLSFDAAHPIAAHELSRWGGCAFQGLSTMVLGLRAGKSAGEELDSADRGVFWHAVLADVVSALEAEGVFGRDDPRVRPLIVAAVEAKAREFEQKASTGHPQLWKLAQEWAVTVIHRLVIGPTATPFGLARPKKFEVSFGRASAPEALREVKIPAARTGETDVFLTGQIDRIDEAQGVVGVVDYKTSARRNVTREFLIREFQMALYLLAARSLSPDAQVNAAWHAVGRNELTPLRSAVTNLSVPELLATDELTRARLAQEEKFNLANSVFALLAKLRRGEFGARPVDCEHCDLKAVCRITDRRLPEERR